MSAHTGEPTLGAERSCRFTDELSQEKGEKESRELPARSVVNHVAMGYSQTDILSQWTGMGSVMVGEPSVGVMSRYPSREGAPGREGGSE